MTTEDFMIDSVVGEIVLIVEPTTVPPPTPDVLGALEDPTLLNIYFTHVASLIWKYGVFFIDFMYFGYLFVLFHTCVLC